MPDGDHRSHAQALSSAAKRAAAPLRAADRGTKDAVLRRVADGLRERAPALVAANREDLEAGKAAGLSEALLDRLALDDKRLEALACAVEAIAALEDPVGRIERLATRPSGIQVGRMMVPLGVILMVYESRPNVTVDAACLCLKAGNAVILRGGKEALHSNRALATVVQDALAAEGLPREAATFVDDPAHELLHSLLGRAGDIDLAIPRGGTRLIDAVNEHARIPVIQHYQGICHVYVHATADLDAAVPICVNAKVQRPGVCNAAEGFLVDEAVAAGFVPKLVGALVEVGVEVRGCPRTLALAAGAEGLVPAGPADFDTEFLGLTCALKVVEGFEEALAFVAAHGSGHTESILTRDHDAAMRFLREVDASCVLVNASTRFNDGGELGLGAELGISTTKLHAYGPMGLEELCTRKFVVLGHGEIRK